VLLRACVEHSVKRQAEPTLRCEDCPLQRFVLRRSDRRNASRPARSVGAIPGPSRFAAAAVVGSEPTRGGPNGCQSEPKPIASGTAVSEPP
jgi:hypothetical protein